MHELLIVLRSGFCTIDCITAMRSLLFADKAFYGKINFVGCGKIYAKIKAKRFSLIA